VVDGRISSWTTLKTEKADWIANKSVSIPFQTGIKRHPDLADVPLFTELASEPDARRILQFVDSDSAVGWSVVAPPDVPAERVATLRRAFDQMVVDPDFLADAKKRNLDVVSSSGVELAAVIKRTLAIPHQDIDRLSQLLSAQK
jgi:alkanesulfonate monooxygenase SsuD/methylene tetrahydromethanopterin reductase-like flavin-dependent oxidoreductase (luciferase family)